MKKEIIRSSAAEYLTFITAVEEGDVNAIYADENVWLTQKSLAKLYDVNVATINEHLVKLYNTNELDNSTIRKFLIVQKEGKRDINRDVIHYNLKTIIAVGNKVNSNNAIQFRKLQITLLKNIQ